MPRKQLDPINGVVDYFETAPIDAAKVALEVAGAIVRRRSVGAKVPAGAPVGQQKKVAAPKIPRAAAPLNAAGPGPAPATVGD